MFYLVGACAGLANGLFGAGGGVLLVPLFLKSGKMSDKETFATSISVIFVLSIVTIITYRLRGDFSVSGGLPFIAGGFIGGVIASKVFKKANVKWLKKALGVLIIYGGVRYLFQF